MTDAQPINPKPEDGVAQALAQAVEKFCRDLIDHLSMDLSVEVREDSASTVVNITGVDRPLLLSNAAAFLNSIEYLINRIFRVGRDEEKPSIMVDSDHYRQHREAELILLAQMAAQKVMSQRKPLNLQPMIARERRIIHLAVSGIEGVRSQSEGEGEDRRIVIYPE